MAAAIFDFFGVLAMKPLYWHDVMEAGWLLLAGIPRYNYSGLHKRSATKTKTITDTKQPPVNTLFGWGWQKLRYSVWVRGEGHKLLFNFNCQNC